jgi:hypothetical protein
MTRTSWGPRAQSLAQVLSDELIIRKPIGPSSTRNQHAVHVPSGQKSRFSVTPFHCPSGILRAAR